MNSNHHSRRLALSLAATFSACAFAGCSGGGGGGGGAVAGVDSKPVLLAATFLGAGANPVVGDKLRFLFSDQISLVAGAILDATDLVVAGGTLGSVFAAPTLVSPHLVEITLGSGVALVTNTTTIGFGTENDVVRDAAGQFVDTATTPVTLKKGDADIPSITNLTLNDIAGTLNGTGAAGGTLQVSSTGFSIDLTHTDTSSAVEPIRTIVTANVPVAIGGSPVAAGQNLATNLTVTGTAASSSLAVPTSVVFPVGAATITCYVVDSSGRVSAATTFAFLAQTMSDALRLFEPQVNASQVWFLDTSRDVESLSVTGAPGAQSVSVTAGANTRSDLEDVLAILGLIAATPQANVSGSKNSNDVVMDLFRAKVLTDAAAFFSGVNVTFTFTAPGAFPAAEFVPYSSFGFSQMCIAGSADTAGNSGVLGLAIFDPHNEVHENDCLISFRGDRLGVFLQTLINRAYQSGPTTQFATVYNLFAPVGIGGGTGVPIGTSPDNNDGLRLTGGLNDQRATDMTNAINNLARFTAVVVCHECGHSLGLVRDGAMPVGLYGNDVTNFPGSTAGHINIAFGAASNIMTPGIGFTSALSPGTRFNSLNTSYLRETATYQ